MSAYGNGWPSRVICLPRRRRGGRTALPALPTAAPAAPLVLHPDAERADAAPAAFVHPGVTVPRSRLDFARSKAGAGARPWKGALDRMTASKYADPNRFQATYEQGAAVPGGRCGGSPHLGPGPVTEVGHNALHNRLGHAMSSTRALTERTRPSGTNDLFAARETLTHGDNPA